MRTNLELGAILDTVSPDELDRIVRQAAADWQREEARAVKYLRFGPLQATINAAAFTFDGSGNSQAGPRAGFIWSIRRLLVTGLAAGATPDVINFYRNNPTGRPVWQLNGNSFGTTFGKTELLLLDGETLSFANSGSITATGTIGVDGDVVEIAAEQIWKLVA